MYSRRSRGYTLPSISDCEVWCGTPLVTITPLLRSMCSSESTLPLDTEGAYHGQMCMVVPVVHLVLLVLAALVICAAGGSGPASPADLDQ